MPKIRDEGRRPTPGLGPLVLLAFALAGSLVQAQVDGQELEGKPISRITFLGLEKLTPEAVKALMQSKEGAPFSRDRLDLDVKRLAGYTATAEEEAEGPNRLSSVRRPIAAPKEEIVIPKVFNIIPSVRAELDAAGTGVDITISAKENRRVVGLVFLGIYHFTREELLPLMRTRAGSLVDDFTLELDKQELLRHYRDKGYHFAEVDFSKTTEKFGDLILFKIVEGEEVTIRSVELQGATAFEKDELLKQMPFTEEPGLFSSREFVLDQVRRDVVQLTSYYRNRGYRDAQATLLEWRPTPDNEEVDLVIAVDEGQPYLVRSITLKGVTLYDPEELKANFRSRIGGRYEPGFDLQRDITAMEERYQSQGYAEVKIDDASTFDLDRNEVDVVLDVAEGDLVYVGEVVIRGNVETQDRILRRDVLVHTGEPIDIPRLMKSKQRIRRLQYWQPGDGVQLVQPSIKVEEFGVYRDAYSSLRDTSRENVKDVVFTVKEADTGSLRFGAGVGSNTGLFGDITYTKTNFDPVDWPESFSDIFDAFTGGGQFLVMSFQPGTVFTRWRLSWGNPRLFDSPWLLAGEVYYATAIREDWDESRLGASVRVGRDIGEDLRGDLTLRDELVDVDDIDGDAPQLVFDFEGENEVVSLTLELRLNKLEYKPRNLIDPIGGYLLQLSVEHAGLWGDIEYNKVLLGGEKYIFLHEDDAERDHVLQLRGSVGWASEYGGTNDIPVYERFFAGGSGTVRGFRYRGIGPRENDSPIGGKALWTAGVEYAYPLIGDAIRGVAFIDAGTVALDWSDSDIGNVRVGGGVGLRVVIPFLGDRPVAVDFGVPFIKDDSDETQLISFSFGRNF